MAVDSPYGFWLFNNQNGLVGAASTVEELPDGRRVLVKDPDLPAVLEDPFILNILQTARQGRNDFNRLFPTLDPVSQDRLTTLITGNPAATALLKGDQAFCDMITHQDVTSGVRTRLARFVR